MPSTTEKLFEDEAVAADEAAVDETIRAAGGERQAIRVLLIQLGETRVSAERTTSLGYRRGRQPARRLP